MLKKAVLKRKKGCVLILCHKNVNLAFYTSYESPVHDFSNIRRVENTNPLIKCFVYRYWKDLYKLWFEM